MVCSKIIGFPHKVILSAMRGYCRYARIAHDVKDPLAKHGIEVDASMINSGAHRFGHEKAKCSFMRKATRRRFGTGEIRFV
tara:strand:+ start:98 stop:340 length:243 start_codon:yes stop_codon:yes gene_type:complete